LRINWLSKNDLRFQRKLAGQNLAITFGARDKNIYRYYQITDGIVSSRRGIPEKSDLHLEFQNARYGFKMLSRKAHNPIAFAKGMSQGSIILKGEMQHIFWLISASKDLPLKRKKAKKGNLKPVMSAYLNRRFI
jgi:hypothetical protein